MEVQPSGKRVSDRCDIPRNSYTQSTMFVAALTLPNRGF